MGIGPEPADDLATIIRPLLPAEFSVCELGDQRYHSGKRRDPKFWSKPAVEMYRKLGCTDYECIDGNGKGTVLADLNYPVDLGRQFDLVTDFGTSEHVFDFAQCWRTMHALVKTGGVIMFEKPYQGYPDHGFYNTHETLWRDLVAANGKMIFLKAVEAPRGTHWRGAYRVTSEAFCTPQQHKWVPKLKI